MPVEETLRGSVTFLQTQCSKHMHKFYDVVWDFVIKHQPCTNDYFGHMNFSVEYVLSILRYLPINLILEVLFFYSLNID